MRFTVDAAHTHTIMHFDRLKYRYNIIIYNTVKARGYIALVGGLEGYRVTTNVSHAYQ